MSILLIGFGFWTLGIIGLVALSTVSSFSRKLPEQCFSCSYYDECDPTLLTASTCELIQIGSQKQMAPSAFAVRYVELTPPTSSARRVT